MGIGVIGQPDITFKRKFRFTFEISGFCGNEGSLVPEHFVQVASRPNLTIEETELNHLNGKFFIPGKATWETITVTYYDVAHLQAQHLFKWLATVYDFTNPINLTMGNKRDYDATGVVNIYDGCGVIIESWQLQHLFPTAINFGDLDYASSDVATIELTMRYSDVLYRSYCPEYDISPCCSGCGETKAFGADFGSNSNG